jgi:hypothetical protein
MPLSRFLPDQDVAHVFKSMYAVSLVGVELEVPNYWWIDASTGKNLDGSRLWKGKIIRVEFPSGGDPLFIFECSENDPDGPYPMKFPDVLRFRKW